MQADGPPVIQVRLAGMVGQLRAPHLSCSEESSPTPAPVACPGGHLAILPYVVDKRHEVGRRAGTLPDHPIPAPEGSPPSSRRRPTRLAGAASSRPGLRAPAARLSASRADRRALRARLFSSLAKLKALRASLGTSRARLSARRASLGTSPAKPRCSATGVPGSVREPTVGHRPPFSSLSRTLVQHSPDEYDGAWNRRARDPRIPLRSLRATDAGGRSRDHDSLRVQCSDASRVPCPNPARRADHALAHVRSPPGSAGWPCSSRLPWRQRRRSTSLHHDRYRIVPRPGTGYRSQSAWQPAGPPQRSASASIGVPFSSSLCGRRGGPLATVTLVFRDDLCADQKNHRRDFQAQQHDDRSRQ
jgi:hypothetical protein